MMFAVIVSCKDDKKSDAGDTTSSNQTEIGEDGKTAKQSDGLIAIHGKFLFVEQDNAAVLQTATQMYGVIINDKLTDLNAQVEQMKTDPYQMIPVTVRGRIIKNEGVKDEWENKIEIKEILKVSKPESEENDVIKLGTN